MGALGLNRCIQSTRGTANFLLARTECMGRNDCLWHALCRLNLLVLQAYRMGLRLHVASSEAGLATGLMCITSGCIWGAAEWGVPWDWTDVRLNTFALLTLLSLYLVLGRRSQPDGVETRDTFAAFGMYGFVLVPVTYIATRLWQIRHPGPVVATSEGSLNSDMSIVLFIGAISFTVLTVGYIMAGMRLTKLEMRLEELQSQYEEGMR